MNPTTSSQSSRPSWGFKGHLEEDRDAPSWGRVYPEPEEPDVTNGPSWGNRTSTVSRAKLNVPTYDSAPRGKQGVKYVKTRSPINIINSEYTSLVDDAMDRHASDLLSGNSKTCDLVISHRKEMEQLNLTREELIDGLRMETVQKLNDLALHSDKTPLDELRSQVTNDLRELTIASIAAKECVDNYVHNMTKLKVDHEVALSNKQLQKDKCDESVEILSSKLIKMKADYSIAVATAKDRFDSECSSVRADADKEIKLMERMFSMSASYTDTTDIIGRKLEIDIREHVEMLKSKMDICIGELTSAFSLSDRIIDKEYDEDRTETHQRILRDTNSSKKLENEIDSMKAAHIVNVSKLELQYVKAGELLVVDTPYRQAFTSMRLQIVYEKDAIMNKMRSEYNDLTTAHQFVVDELRRKLHEQTVYGMSLQSSLDRYESVAAARVVAAVAPAPEPVAEEEAAAPEPAVEEEEEAAAPEPVAEEDAAAPEPVAEEEAAAAPEPVAEEEEAAAAPEPVAEEEAAAAPEPVAEEEAAASEPVAEEEAAAPEPVEEEEAAASEPVEEEEAAAPEPVAEEEAAAPEPAVEEEEEAATPEPVAEEEAAAPEPVAEEEEEEAAASEPVAEEEEEEEAAASEPVAEEVVE